MWKFIQSSESSICMWLIIHELKVLKIKSTLQINSTTSFRQITTYRQILATPPIEYCALTKDITNLPSIWKTIALEFFKRNPNSLLICPLKEWKLYNITIENAMHLLWPSGEYKNVIHLYNDQDEKLLKFTFNVQLINTKW